MRVRTLHVIQGVKGRIANFLPQLLRGRVVHALQSHSPLLVYLQLT